LPGQRFVARQPIFERAQKVFGSELLFGNGIENYFNADPESAARSMLDSCHLFGINTLSDNRRAFVNCTREVLFKDLITLLPPSEAVAEIPETVEPEDRVIAACKRSKAFGYPIALDVVYGASINSILPSRVRWSTSNRPFGSRKMKTSLSRKCASLMASSKVMGRSATESLERTRCTSVVRATEGNL
jgi:hypothetical protein